jgi:primosomal protein N' (replication factor Y)
MSGRITLFADVVVPVPLAQYFTYRVPLEHNDAVQPGTRVIVQFGSKKILTAIVVRVHENPPKNYEAKYILEILDDTPLLQPVHLQFWEWIASYYLCTVGDVMQVGLPSGLKLTSQSRIQLHPEADLELLEADLNEREMALLVLLKKESFIPYEEAAELLGKKNIYHALKYLVVKQAIIIFEEVNEKYKPKIVRKVRLGAKWLAEPQGFDALFEKVKGKEQQENLLLTYFAKVPVLQNPQANKTGLAKASLLEAGGSASSYTTLKKHGILEEFDVVVSRFETDHGPMLPIPALSDAQANARDQILAFFQEKNDVLLFGVTGSGKTEIYIDLIERALSNGSQVLLLLPEIVLTAQIVMRLKKHFGNKLGVYHSKYSDNERVEVWRGVATGSFQVVVGVRSSIFLPFQHLGLIIIDEEHDSSYKQQDPAPRYHARDASLMLARFHQAKVLLGSATPSVETYFMATQGKMGLVQLFTRYGQAQLPTIVLSNSREERKKKKMKGEFTSLMLEELTKNQEQKQQAILFQNRRGFAPHITCDDCGWIPRCEQCSVSLTYHMYRNELRCHYCGYKQAVPNSCYTCSSSKLKTVGAGTEKLEDELKIYLPETRVQRMDLDTTRSKFSYQQIIQDFETRQTDVLVGTQMVSKGLDFDHVTLVGIFDIDRMMHFPDFRAFERTFQLVSQVSGRAGRKEHPGLVIIQTGNPGHPLLQKIIQHDYLSFYQEEIQERARFHYPPFTRLIRLTVRHEDLKKVEEIARTLAQTLVDKLGKQRVLGPEVPMVDKIRNLYLRNILIKLERGRPGLEETKNWIRQTVEDASRQKNFTKVSIVTDVDCQ